MFTMAFQSHWDALHFKMPLLQNWLLPQMRIHTHKCQSPNYHCFHKVLYFPKDFNLKLYVHSFLNWSQCPLLILRSTSKTLSLSLSLSLSTTDVSFQGNHLPLGFVLSTSTIGRTNPILQKHKICNCSGNLLVWIVCYCTMWIMVLHHMEHYGGVP